MTTSTFTLKLTSFKPIKNIEVWKDLLDAIENSVPKEWNGKMLVDPEDLPAKKARKRKEAILRIVPHEDDEVDGLNIDGASLPLQKDTVSEDYESIDRIVSDDEIFSSSLDSASTLSDQFECEFDGKTVLFSALADTEQEIVHTTTLLVLAVAVLLKQTDQFSLENGELFFKGEKLMKTTLLLSADAYQSHLSIAKLKRAALQDEIKYCEKQCIALANTSGTNNIDAPDKSEF